MKLTVKKEVEETFEVETPAYFKSYGNIYYKITEEGLLHIYDNSIFITHSSQESFGREVRGIIKSPPSTEEEFMEAYDKAFDAINKFVNASTLVL